RRPSGPHPRHPLPPSPRGWRGRAPRAPPGGLGGLAWRVLISPLMTRLTDQFLASRVENMHPGLSDDLMSAVHFIHAGTYRTNVLASRHVDAAAEKAAGIRFEEAVDFRRSAKALLLAVLVAGVVALIAGMNSGLARIGISRWFAGSTQAWPRVTTVEFVWDTLDGKPPAVAPIGEQLLVRAKVVRGGYANQYVTLTTWSDTKRSTDELMTFQRGMSSGQEYVYERTMEPEGQHSFSMKLSAGDDREQEPVTIRLAPRPVVRQLTASIVPPGYVRDVKNPAVPAPAVVADLMNQSGRAVEGATITLHVKSSKPFATDGSGAPEIRFLDQNKDEDLGLATERKLVSPADAEITFPARKTVQARLSMRDTDGFENRVGGSLTIEVVPDNLPSVVITEPRTTVERVAGGTVDVSVQATDDLGLDGLKLVAEKFDAKPGERPVVQMALPWTDRNADAAAGSTTGRSQYTWNLAPLNLAPGARLTFYAMVQDNYEVAGKRHPWVKSPGLSLQIRSEAEIADARRRELNEIKERIKALRGQQEETRRKTDAIQKSVAASGTTTAQEKAMLSQLAQQESEEAAAANAIQQRTQQVAQDLRQNNMGGSDLGKLAESVSAGMKDVGGNNMPAAAGKLNQARDAAGNQQQQNEKAKQEAQQAAAAAEEAGEQQSQAISKLDSMIGQLGAAGDFEAIRSELQQLKDKQEAVAKQTRDLSLKTIGQKPEELPKDLWDALSGLSDQQKNLSNQSSELINRMQKAAEQLKGSDPASSESLQRSSQAGQDNQVSSAQGSASKSISQNEMNDAGNEQGRAQRGLQQMLDEMNKNENRQLEQLSRDLQELIDQVRQLRESEGGLQKETTAAADADLAKLGDRQGQLQMNTIVVQKRAESTRGAEKAAGDIRAAGESMASAAGALLAMHKADAGPPEGEAIKSLDEAIKKLQAEKEKVDSQIKEKQLGEFVQQYEQIKGGQAGIKKASDDIDARKQAAADKQVSRLDPFQLLKLAAKQGGLAGQIEGLSKDDRLKDFAVIVWMNKQIADSMHTSQKGLRASDMGRELADAQQNAIDRIQDIIDALKEEQKRQSDFRNDNGGGGGGGGGGKQPLVPPLAQLKLLKAMQLVVNGKTVEIDRSISNAADNAAKSHLQEQSKKLGQQQGEIKDIANKIIEQMQQ
ncbi:MAG: hypothetical protein ACTHN5_15535, partial [Phycisphaerae bacterium]